MNGYNNLIFTSMTDTVGDIVGSSRNDCKENDFINRQRGREWRTSDKRPDQLHRDVCPLSIEYHQRQMDSLTDDV
jgi:hypothetical protein